MKKEKEKGALKESKAEVVAEAWTKALLEPRASRHYMKSSSVQEKNPSKPEREFLVAAPCMDEVNEAFQKRDPDKTRITQEAIGR